MDFDLSEALSVFQELDSRSDDARGIHWLCYQRADGITITLVVSTQDADVTLITRNKGDDGSASSLHFSECGSIRFLERKTVELTSVDVSRYRCLIYLDGETIVELES